MRKFIIALFLIGLFSFAGNAQTYFDSTKMNTYLFENFPLGTVLMKNGGKEITPLNYDTYDQSIVFKKNNQIFTITDPITVDTVYILDKKFIPLKNGFFEVAAGNSSTSLCVSYTSKTRPLVSTSDHNGSSRQTSNQVSNTVSNVYVSRAAYNGAFSVEFIKHYWVKVYNDVYKANTEKQFIKAIPSHMTTAANEYIKEHNVNFSSEKDVAALVNFCNEQKKN